MAAHFFMTSKNYTQVPLNGLFATPFYKASFGFSAEREVLKSLLLSREVDQYRNSDSPQNVHSKVFESNFDLLSWPDDVVQNFKSALNQHLMYYLVAVNGVSQQDLQGLRFQNEAWFHVTRSGGYFQPHTHPLASVSVIYCVCPGDQSVEDDRESGSVIFSDPRGGASMYIDPVNRNMKRAFSFDAIRFRFAPDEICIFPSYLQHSVEPYVGNNPRVTIAANFSFDLK